MYLRTRGPASFLRDLPRRLALKGDSDPDSSATPRFATRAVNNLVLYVGAQVRTAVAWWCWVPERSCVAQTIVSRKGAGPDASLHDTTSWDILQVRQYDCVARARARVLCAVSDGAP